jgi:hypothetical protein
MRPRMFALIGLSVGMWLCGTAGLAVGQEFKPFASSAGRYKVLFPGAVKSETIEVPAGKDKIILTIDTVELRAGTSFMVTFVDASDEIAKQPAGPRLDKVRDGNKGTDGKVLEEKDLTVGIEKYPARDVLIEKRDGCIRNRIVIAGNRLYQVTVQGPKDVVTSASADRFFDSFEVTK